jgi:hypothetical protein
VKPSQAETWPRLNSTAREEATSVTATDPPELMPLRLIPAATDRKKLQRRSIPPQRHPKRLVVRVTTDTVYQGRWTSMTRSTLMRYQLTFVMSSRMNLENLAAVRTAGRLEVRSSPLPRNSSSNGFCAIRAEAFW